jgi:hypothetical protein
MGRTVVAGSTAGLEAGRGVEAAIERSGEGTAGGLSVKLGVGLAVGLGLGLAFSVGLGLGFSLGFALGLVAGVGLGATVGRAVGGTMATFAGGLGRWAGERSPIGVGV